jgi:hypothetical protein
MADTKPYRFTKQNDELVQDAIRPRTFGDELREKAEEASAIDTAKFNRMLDEKLREDLVQCASKGFRAYDIIGETLFSGKDLVPMFPWLQMWCSANGITCSRIGSTVRLSW